MNPNRKTFKRKEYEKSFRPWNLQNLNKSAKSKPESSSSLGDNSSNTSPTTPTTLSFPQQISSFEKSQPFNSNSNSINQNDNTWVSNNKSPLIEKKLDYSGVITWDQLQSHFSSIQTSALSNSYASDTDHVHPDTFIDKEKPSWEASTEDIPTDSNQIASSSWSNNSTNSDNSSWATAHTSSPPAEPTTITEQEMPIHSNDINFNNQPQLQNLFISSSTPITKNHSPSQSEPSTPLPSLARHNKEMDKRNSISISSGEKGNWNQGTLVNDWNEFNQVMVKVTTSTQRKLDILPQEPKVSSFSNNDSLENLSSFQEQQQGCPLKSIIDDHDIIQKEKTTINVFDSSNDPLPTTNAHVDKTFKEESKFDFSTSLWDDTPFQQQEQQLNITKSLPTSTTETSTSKMKRYGNTSSDSIHNPIKNVYDDDNKEKEEEGEVEWVTCRISASQTPVPSSSFSTMTPSSSSPENIIPSRRYSREELYGMSSQQEDDIGNTAASLINKQIQEANKRKYKQQEIKPKIIQTRPVRQPPKDHSGGFSPGIPPARPRTTIVVYHDL